MSVIGAKFTANRSREWISLLSNPTLRELSIHLEWQTIMDGSVPANCYTKGRKRGKGLRAKLAGPQVYRWIIKDGQDNIAALYIGESGKLQQRLALYRNGHKKPKDTVNYIRQCLEKSVLEGHRVELQLLNVEPFLINGAIVDASRLSDPAVRKLLENIAILEARGKKIKVLNRGEDSNLKMARSVLSKLSPDEQAAVMERYRPNTVEGSELE